MNRIEGFAGTKRYAPIRLLGRGGMGAVYEALDRATGARVALKVMLPKDAGRLLRFKQEFRVMAELHHPHLVRLFDLGQHEGQWFFTMELVHGQDLLGVLHDDAPPTGATATHATMDRTAEETPDGGAGDAGPRGPACDPEALVGIVAQLLDALEFLHGRGIVHRDLKPNNVLVDVDGNVRVLDFGLASRLDDAGGVDRRGAVVGTLAYLSPEQLRGEAASAASDMYALGCMMFQILTGALPFMGAAALGKRAPPRADERVSGAPPALVEVIHRLMAREPAERPGIDEVRAALELPPGPRTAARDDGTTTAEIFVGRQREIAALSACLDRAAAGEAQLALVSGPSGIGKSALAAAVARRAERLGFLCFTGRCYEREQVPFVAFDRVMDAVTLSLREWAPARLAPLAPALAVLERIFPALGMLTFDLDGAVAPDADPRELHQQAFDGFRRLCAALQARSPICVVLDDLQWADEESLALLDALLLGGARSAGRIAVLGLLRPDRDGATPVLDRLAARTGGRATVIHLEALGSSDAQALVQAASGGRLAPELAETLAAQAEGNPFLVRRLAEHLATIAPGERTARLDTLGSADDLIRRMIQGLSPRAEQALALAATAGGDVPASLLRETSGLGREDLDLAVGELLAARFFKAVPPGSEAEARAELEEALPRLDLYHDRIREVAYEGLDDARRRELHRRLAVALEAASPGRGRDAEVLVRHWSGAGDRARERRYAIEAAEQAASKLAFLRAARLFLLVLDDPDPGEDPLVTAGRWERAGDLFEYGGQYAEAARAYEEAQRRWDALREDHPGRDLARLRLRGLAGVNRMAVGCVMEARAAFESGLALLGLPLERPGYERLAVLAALGGAAAIAERAGDLPFPRRVGARAATEVRFLDLAVRAFQPVWPMAAAEAALRSELLARRIDDKRVLHRSLAFGAAVPVLLGKCSPAQLDRAHQRLDLAEELARANDLPLGRELCQINRSLLWLATNMDRARQTCEAGLEGMAQRGMAASFDGHVARIYLLFVLIAKGDDDDALALIDRQIEGAHPPYVNLVVALSAQVRILVRRGELDGAREALERLRGHVAGVPPSRLDLILATARAWVAVAEGRLADVLAEAEAVERAARENGAWAVGLDRMLWLEVALAAALGLLRRHALPARARRAARAWARWLAERGALEGVCHGQRALALIDHAAGDARAARRWLRQALATSSSNTAPHARWLCLSAAREMGAITMDQESEAAELGAKGRFVPFG